MKFENNSKQIKSNLNQAAVAAVLAAQMIVEADYKANSRVDTGETRDSITHSEPTARGDEITGQVGGSNLNHLWEEYGTGEYAINGDGRKGGWVYTDPKTGETVFTYGKSPNPALRNAFRNKKEEIKRAMGGEFTSGMGGK